MVKLLTRERELLTQWRDRVHPDPSPRVWRQRVDLLRSVQHRETVTSGVPVTRRGSRAGGFHV